MSQHLHEIEGYNYNPVQCNEISSSTDVLIPIWNFSPLLPRFPSCRRSYSSRIYYPFDNSLLRRTRNEMQHRPLPINAPNPVCNPRRKSLENLSTKTALIYVAIIFLCSLATLSFVYTRFPNVTDDEWAHIKIPWNMNDAKQLGVVLDRYKHENFYEVLTGVFITYIFLQTFAIPGSLFLSILSGFLFPFFGALALVCTCSAIGASLCFLLSQLLGRKLILTYFPERANKWAVIVNKQRNNLLNYIIFLRVTPFLPNWFINLTAPIIGVPLKPFALGTFIGVAPPSFIAIHTGQTLHTMSSEGSFSWFSVCFICICAVGSLIPVLFKKQIQEKYD